MVHLSREEIELGAITVLMRQAVHERISRAKAIRRQLEGGAELSDHELHYLLALIATSTPLKPMFDAHPELHAMSVQRVELTVDIVQLAVANEERIIRH
jgi:hypothetical protein